MTQPDQYLPATALTGTGGFADFTTQTQADYEAQFKGPWDKILAPLVKICNLIGDLPFIQGLAAAGRAFSGSTASAGPLGDMMNGIDAIGDRLRTIIQTLKTTLQTVTWTTPEPNGVITAFTALVQFVKDLIDWVVWIVQTLIQTNTPVFLQSLKQVFEIDLLHADWNQLTAAWRAINWGNWAVVPDLKAAWGAVLTFLQEFVQWGRLVIENISGFDLFKSFQGFAFPQLRVAVRAFRTTLEAINWAQSGNTAIVVNAIVKFLQDVGNWILQVLENLYNNIQTGPIHDAFSSVPNFLNAFGLNKFILSVETVANNIVDTVVNTFLGQGGSGFSLSEFVRAIQSIPGQLITGALAPGQISHLNIGTLSPFLPEFLVNPNFDTANSILGQLDWIWDGTQGPAGVLTSVFSTMDGLLKELFSNPIAVAPGQVLAISGNAQWTGVSGSTIALTVAKFDSTSTLLGNDTVASVASPGVSSGWTVLSNNYTIPSGVSTVVLRPIAQATTGKVWFGKLSVKQTGTSLLAQLVPLLDASKIGTGQFSQTQVINLPTDLTARALTTDLTNGWNTIISALNGTGTGLAGVQAALLSIPGANISGTISAVAVNIQNMIDAILLAFNPSYVAGSGSLPGVTGALGGIPIGNITNLTTNLNAKALATDLTALMTNLGAGVATLTAIGNRLANLTSGGAYNGAIPLGNVTSLTNYLSHLSSSGVIDSILSVSGLGNYLQNMSTGGVLNGVNAVTGLPTALNAKALASDLNSLLTNLFGTPALGTVLQYPALPNITVGGSAADIQASLQAFADQITAAVNMGTGHPITTIGTAFQNIPGFNVFGPVGGNNNSTHQSLWDAIVNGIHPGSGTGNGVADVQAAVATLANSVTTLQNGKNSATAQYPATGTFTYTLPTWMVNGNSVDIIVLGGGGGGAGGTAINLGNGGSAGVFNSVTLVKGTGFTASSFTVTVGAGGGGGGIGGLAGAAGGGSSVNYGTGTLTGAGGTYGVGNAVNPNGLSPGSVTVQGIVYVGGANQSSPGANGQSSGGGGAGGNVGFAVGPGGAGAAGCVWIRAYQ
jgi:hypothetical protein